MYQIMTTSSPAPSAASKAIFSQEGKDALVAVPPAASVAESSGSEARAEPLGTTMLLTGDRVAVGVAFPPEPPPFPLRGVAVGFGRCVGVGVGLPGVVKSLGALGVGVLVMPHPPLAPG